MLSLFDKPVVKSEKALNSVVDPKSKEVEKEAEVEEEVEVEDEEEEEEEAGDPCDANSDAFDALECKICPLNFDISDDKKRCDIPFILIDTVSTPKDSVCDTRPYDFVLIPNYHLSNSYVLKKDEDDADGVSYGCLKPCESNYVPYKEKNKKKSTNEKTQCIKKSIIEYGKYGQTSLDFCPIVIIQLLSINSIIDNTKMNILKNLNLVTDIALSTDVMSLTKSFETIQTDFNKDIIKVGKKFLTDNIVEYNKNSNDYFNKIKFTEYELYKCIEILKPRTSETVTDNLIKNVISNSYNIHNDIEAMGIDDSKFEKYLKAYEYIESETDKALKDFHIKFLKWACATSFDPLTVYGQSNRELYKSENTEMDNSNNILYKYRRDVNNGTIESNMFFNFVDILYPVKIFSKIFKPRNYKNDKYNNNIDDSNNHILNNKFLIAFPKALFFYIFILIIFVLLFIFQKYTRYIYLYISVYFNKTLLYIAQLPKKGSLDIMHSGLLHKLLLKTQNSE